MSNRGFNLYFLILISLLSLGCNELFDRMTGHEHHVVVLKSEPIILDKTPLTLHSTNAMKVIGKHSAVCFPIAEGISVGNMDKTYKIFHDVMQDVSINIIVQLTSGEKYTLDTPMQAWSRSGEILDSGELSACASFRCCDKIPIGKQISEIQITSSEPLKVKGIFWKSTKDFDKVSDRAKKKSN